jgi:hypothetical protein
MARGGHKVKTEIHPAVFVVALLIIIAIVIFAYQRYSGPPVLSPSEAERIRKALKYDTLQPRTGSSPGQPNQGTNVPSGGMPSR